MAIRRSLVVQQAKHLEKRDWFKDEDFAVRELEFFIDEELKREIQRCNSSELRPPPGERCYTVEVLFPETSDELLEKLRFKYRLAGWNVQELSGQVFKREGLLTDYVHQSGVRVCLCES